MKHLSPKDQAKLQAAQTAAGARRSITQTSAMDPLELLDLVHRDIVTRTENIRNLRTKRTDTP